MSTLKTYDPDNILVVVTAPAKPPFTLSGFADGTYVKVTRATDAYTKVVGVDGSVTRIKSNDKSGEIEITLAQTSPSNTSLALLATADELANAGVCNVSITDLDGLSLYGSTQAWVKKQPDAEYGKDMTNRVWVLECAKLNMLTNGSGDGQ